MFFPDAAEAAVATWEFLRILLSPGAGPSSKHQPDTKKAAAYHKGLVRETLVDRTQRDVFFDHVNGGRDAEPQDLTCDARDPTEQACNDGEPLQRNSQEPPKGRCQSSGPYI